MIEELLEEIYSEYPELPHELFELAGKAYSNDQRSKEETKKVISYDKEGTKWLNLGDCLQQDEDGFYKYVGRQKRNFVCGCDNIYPEQIEELLVTMPEVREAVIIPRSDGILQYIPIYNISLYSDGIDYQDFENRLKKLITTSIGESALPSEIHYTVEPLVRMTNSKIDIEYYKNQDSKSCGKAKVLKK